MQETLDFVKEKKKILSENRFRQEYNKILDEYNKFAVNTVTQKNTIDQSTPESITILIPRADGTNDFAIYPRVKDVRGSESDTPRAEVPIAYSKILVASSAIASNMPNGTAYSINKIKARTFYEYWKRSWSNPEMNGANTLDFATQQMIATGTGAWRIFPRQVVVDKKINGKKTKKVIYDDIYREPLDMNRTWFGLSYSPKSYDGRPEVLWEVDVTIEEFEKMKKRFGKRAKKVRAKAEINTVSQEATNEDPDKTRTHVTISCYECPKDNRYILCSDSVVFYDDEMPNDEVYGSVVIAHCLHKNMVSPYGVGLWELIRGNQTIQNYIESLNTEQVASEIIPLIFATGNIQGDMEMKRSTTKVNVVPAGVKVERMITTGNATLGENYIERKKKEVDDITGVNDIVAGSSSEQTLGATVILKEAALNRLMKPRNSLKRAIEIDACIQFSWIEQDHVNPRELIFANEEDVEAFKQANPMLFSEVEEVGEEVEAPEMKDGEPNSEEGTDSGVIASYKVFYSPKLPMNFDYNKEDLEESGYENQAINEVGGYNTLVPRSVALGELKDLEAEDKIGYDKVTLIIDPNSMLIPSAEIQKQTAMQLFPLVQNTITQIFQMAQADPALAQAQLKAFEKFLEVQRENIMDWMPKESYDAIKMGQTQAPQIDPMTGQPMMPGGVGPVPPEQMPNPANASPFGQAINGGVTGMDKKIAPQKPRK